MCCQDIVSDFIVLVVSTKRRSSLLLRDASENVFKTVIHTIQYVFGECLLSRCRSLIVYTNCKLQVVWRF